MMMIARSFTTNRYYMDDDHNDDHDDDYNDDDNDDDE